MADEQKKIIPINYTNREFQEIRRDLLQIAERNYPDTFQDFSQASFGSIMVDNLAYVADQLSFYLDYNVNETFLDTAYQYENIIRHGRTLGFKENGRASTFGKVALYVLVPASPTGLGPDRRYIPIMKKGSTFSSDTGLNYVLTENIDFSEPKTQVIAARSNPTTGAPTFYAIKTYGNVVSGRFGSERVVVGAYERFKTITLSTSNISEIISVFDEQGNEYYEVEYLAQDLIFKEVSNSNYKNDNVPSILKPFLASRKFVVNRSRSSVTLQFGSGKSGETNVVADPAEVAMDVFGKTYVTNTTFDPSRLTKNESMGIVPSDTTLTIRYRATNPTNSNLAVGALNRVTSALMDFEDRNSLSATSASDVISSIEVSNEEPIVGDVTNPTSSEIKRRIFDTFPTQNRAVTQADYENMIYRMPSKFGSIKRCSAQRDPDSRRRNINIYVISEDNFNNLTSTNSTIKNNLKTWMNNYRMLSDTIDVLDAFIINYGIEFVVRPSIGADRFTLVDTCINILRDKYTVEKLFIGEHIDVADIYTTLSGVEGVLSVSSVKIVNKNGSNYSATQFDINENTSPDGSSIIIPKNAVAELKFPTVDIVGKIK
jgi:hypothetical protein|tara:strand:- start:540 stop:2339 length:1800 start_codon:yes stop_codon:yes gene_type:complete